MRINRALAFLGAGSRRKVEELVRAGRVRVNRQVVTDLSLRVDPWEELIEVDGRRLSPPPLLYFAYHKPPGIISTLRDERGRKSLAPVAAAMGGGVFPVGRLDRESEGLMVFTNDGEFAHRLLHPRFGFTRHYLVWVKGKPSRKVLRALIHGVDLGEPRPARALEVRTVGRERELAKLVVVVEEGRKRLVRRMFQALGHPVVRLMRLSHGPISLGDLPAGSFRPLREEEIRPVLKEAELDASRPEAGKIKS